MPWLWSSPQAGPWRSIFQSVSKLLESLIIRTGLPSMLFKMTTRLGECQDHFHRLQVVRLKKTQVHVSEYSMSVHSLFILPVIQIHDHFSFVNKITQWYAVAFQTFQKNKYIGCASTYCTLTTGPGLYMNDNEWVTHTVTDFQIYRMNGKGSARSSTEREEFRRPSRSSQVPTQWT